MTDELRVYFAFRSPYSRLGLHKIDRAKLSNVINLKIIPFLAPAGEAPFFDPVTSPPKLAYYMEDVPRATLGMRLPIRPPDPFDVDMDLALKAFFLASREGKAMAFALAVSDARWGKGRNVSEREVLETCAAKAGLEADIIDRAINAPDLEADFSNASACVERDAVFGVPFAVLERDGQAQKFWGQDRFDLLIDLLAE